MRFTSVPISFVLHGAAIAVVAYGVLPEREMESFYVPPVPVEVITRAELDEMISVPEMRRAEDPVEEEPVVQETEPEHEPEPVAEEPAPVEAEPEPVIEPEAEPEVVEPEPDIDPTPEPDVEEPEPVTEPDPPAPAPEPEVDPLAGLGDVLRDLDPDRERSRPNVINPDAIEGDRDQEQIGSGLTLSVTEEAMIQACVQQEYTLDRTAAGWESFVFEVRVQLNVDTTLARPVEILNQRAINRSGNPAYQAAVRNVIAAVNACFPFEGDLDPARYDAWRSFKFNFRPQ